MTIYARQINPEYQESPFQWNDEVWKDVIFSGNRNYQGRNDEILKTIQKNISDCYNEYIEAVCPDSCYNTKEEVIADFLPPMHKEQYNEEDMKQWEIFMETYGELEELTKELTLDILHIMTGRKYLYAVIRGSSQSEWQEIYYPANYIKETIKALECEYFNTGSEWVVHDSDEVPTKAEEIDGCCTYCHGCTDEEIAEEIRQEFSKVGDKVILYKWDGYIKTPKYENVTIG